MSVELFEDVGPHVPAPDDREDLEQAPYRRAGAEIRGIAGVKRRLSIKELEAQEGPHAFIERLLERNRVRIELRMRDFCGVLDHPAILRDLAGSGNRGPWQRIVRAAPRPARVLPRAPRH